MNVPGFEHEVVRLSGLNLHAVIGGQGPPVVLLHGFPNTWYVWRKIMPILGREFTVVAPDIRGAGHSDCPPGGYDKATMAADIHELMGALGHRTYAACGHDIGAMVALALAFGQREAVAKVAILDAPMPGWSRWTALFSDPRLWHFAFHMKRHLPERLIFGREYDYVASFIFDRAADHGAHEPSDIEVYARALAQPGRTTGGLEWYRAFDKDHADALAWKERPLDIPTLALGGDRRWGPEMVAMMSEFSSRVEGGSIARCNHWLLEERPQETAEALLAFLRKDHSAAR